MSCFYPNVAVRQFKKIDGKWKIKFLPHRVDFNVNQLRRKYGDDLFLIPCGKCLGCKFDKARDWATRCYCESLYHDKSCFVTLTYDDFHRPGKLWKKDSDKFIKDLRNRGINLRVFGCGELGETTRREHFHLILFGYKPEDLEFHSRGSNGDALYTSKFLESIWKKGFVVVGDVSFKTAGYVARYTTKKIGDDSSFLFCSNRPGIGYQYIVDHAEAVLKSGYVYGDFGDAYRSPIPRYFEKYLLENYPDEFEKLVSERIVHVRHSESNSLIHHCFLNPEELKILNGDILNRKLSRIHRR